MTTDKADIKLSKCRSRSGAKSPQESLQRQAILLPLRKTYHHFEKSTSRLEKNIRRFKLFTFSNAWKFRRKQYISYLNT